MRRREVVRFVEIASTSSGNATSSSPSCPFSRARFLSPAVIARGGSHSFCPIANFGTREGSRGKVDFCRTREGARAHSLVRRTIRAHARRTPAPALIRVHRTGAKRSSLSPPSRLASEVIVATSAESIAGRTSARTFRFGPRDTRFRAGDALARHIKRRAIRRISPTARDAGDL